ncbi:MAG: HisS family protein, partial [candidate division NC10 bacterium]
MLEPRKISGFADYSEAQNAALSRWIDSLEETFRLYGFTRLTPRPLELREVLLSRGGIQKQIFGISRLPDDASTELALPFDRTVPLAHWVGLNAKEIVFPYKRWDISHSFRGERAQAGRFQGFFQADVDIIGQGKLDLNADAECIAVLYEAVAKLALGEAVVSLNHIRLAKALLSGTGASNERLGPALRVLDKLEKQGYSATAEELQRTAGLNAGQAASAVDLFTYKGRLSDFSPGSAGGEAFEQGLGELRAVWDGLLSLGVPESALTFRPGVVRGLDYYTGVVFETTLKGGEDFGSVAGGGRYDDLASTFTDMSLPGVGGSIGLTRLFDAACKGGLVDLASRTEAQVFVGFRTPELKALAQTAAKELRSRGIRVDLYSGPAANVGKQLAYAGKKGLRTAVMAMDAKSIVVRDLAKSEQK